MELSEARQLIETRGPKAWEKGMPNGDEFSGFWNDWLEAFLLQNEAAANLEGKSPPSLIKDRN